MLNFLRTIWPIPLCLLSVSSQSVVAAGSTMTQPKPLFKFPLEKMKVPSLKLISDDTATGVRKKLYSFSSEFAEILLKHLTNESEVQIVQGHLTQESHQQLIKLESEMNKLQYRSHLSNILHPWAQVCCLASQLSLK